MVAKPTHATYHKCAKIVYMQTTSLLLWSLSQAQLFISLAYELVFFIRHKNIPSRVAMNVCI